MPPRRDRRLRVADWREVYEQFADPEAAQQGGRCMDCGVPFCQEGCPLGNYIPDWNHAVYQGRWRDAHELLAATNNFPEFTGTLCPAPCEAACTLSINDRPVTIEQIERKIVDRAFEAGWVEARPPVTRTGKSVAVVGSGPAGLAAAAQLNEAGHRVVVLEADDRIGGLLRYGIPDFKMEKWVLDRRLELLSAAGIELRTGVAVGDAVSWADLLRLHDAVVIAVGSRRPRALEVPGRDLDGVCFAMDYLTRQNRIGAGDADVDPTLDSLGRKVVILGGGDTGSDCLGTALRQGAESVLQVELLPRPPDERAAGNPWPEWPAVFRTSTSQEEGGERRWALLTKELRGSGGRLERLIAAEVSFDGGRLVEREGAAPVEIAVDQLILAMGFVGPETAGLADIGVELDDRGNVATGDDHATTADGVFCAGDANRGQSLIVWAIAEGRQAAAAVDAYLR
jgi:glutamate synthase (NADPH/NADH) small chain